MPDDNNHKFNDKYSPAEHILWNNFRKKLHNRCLRCF